MFTVQSPPSQFFGWRPRINIAYGARGVGMRVDLALDGALAAYYETAVRSEPTCRVVDDIVVSAFFASRKIAVRDVPGFSFENRPWRHNNQIRLISKQHARGRTSGTPRTRGATTRSCGAMTAPALMPPQLPPCLRGVNVASKKATRRIHMRRNDTTTARRRRDATAKHAKKRRNSIRHTV